MFTFSTREFRANEDEMIQIKPQCESKSFKNNTILHFCNEISLF